MLSGEGVGEDDYVTALAALCASVDATEGRRIRLALSEVLVRLLEARLLGDEDLREVARYPDVYLGQSREIVASRIEALGLATWLDEQDVEYLARLLTSGVPHTAGPEPVGSELVANVFRDIYRRDLQQLRCAICGFHFRACDVSDARRAIARQFEFEYAQDLDARRVADRIKPPRMTRLHIDHVVPRLGWGPTRANNLQILCEFCNQGKLSFRRGLENVSGFAAGSIPPLDRLPPDWAVRQTVVAALMTAQGHCATCSRSAYKGELTVVRQREWFVPWTLEVRCYDCVDCL